VETFVEKCSSGLHEDSRADMGVKRINRIDVGGAARSVWDNLNGSKDFRTGNGQNLALTALFVVSSPDSGCV